MADPAVVPAALLVQEEGRGSQACGRDGRRRRACGGRLTGVDMVGAMLRGASPPPDPDTLEIRRVMVASEGRKISHDVIVRAMELARPHGASLFVMTIARVWGTSLGFPNPGLMPSKHEGDEQRLNVREAVSAFQKAGFEADGMVLAPRRGAKRILREAR